jgi:hypothetical protein
MKIFKNEIENTQKDISVSNLFDVKIEQEVINYLYEFLFDDFLLSFNIF